MKKVLAAVVVSSFLVVGLAQAEGPKGPKGPKGGGPCHELVKSCRAAGFEPGHHKEGKGLWLDCVAKLVAGESVSGVTFQGGEEQKSACKAEMEKRQEHRKAKKEKKKGEAAAPAAEAAE